MSHQQQPFILDLKTQNNPYYLNHFLHQQNSKEYLNQNLNYLNYNTPNNNLTLPKDSAVISFSQQSQNTNQQNYSNFNKNIVPNLQNLSHQPNISQTLPTTLQAPINSSITTKLQPSQEYTFTQSIPSLHQSIIQPSQTSIGYNSYLKPVTSVSQQPILVQTFPFSNFETSNTQLEYHNYNQSNLKNVSNQQILTPVNTLSCKLPLITEPSNIEINQNLSQNTIPMFYNTTFINNNAINNTTNRNFVSSSQPNLKNNFNSPFFSTPSLIQNNVTSPWHQNLSSMNPYATATVKETSLNNINSLSKMCDNLSLNTLKTNNVVTTNLIHQTESSNFLSSNKTSPNFQLIVSHSNPPLTTNNQILNYPLIPEFINQQYNLNNLQK